MNVALLKAWHKLSGPLRHPTRRRSCNRLTRVTWRDQVFAQGFGC